jgi:hypothetical protein
MTDGFLRFAGWGFPPGLKLGYQESPGRESPAREFPLLCLREPSMSPAASPLSGLRTRLRAGT